MKNLSHYTYLLCELETSLLMRGIQIVEMSKLGWLIGLVMHAIWADSLYFLNLLLLSISKILASSQPIQCPSTYACWAKCDFLRRFSLRLCLCSWSRTTRGLPVSPIYLLPIHRKYYRLTAPSAVDLFPAWFS
jgi:hypothetical protein